MISHRIDVAAADGAPQTHQFRITLRVPRPVSGQRFSLPAWIPGSYLLREFSRHVSAVSATQGGVAVALEQIDKATWSAGCGIDGELVVSYFVYAFDNSVRAAFLDTQRGFFNGTSVFMRVEGGEAEAQRMEIGELPVGWQVATSMAASGVDEHGRGSYQAADYDELVDHPVELGRFWRGRFTARGVPHEFVVVGALPDFDGERLLADSKRICEAEIDFWHGGREAPPFDRYLFLLNAVEDGYGGLEHRASTALIAARRDLPRLGAKPDAEPAEAYITLLGLISHEYFHTWNVKRLKPREFARYDYTRENYTELLWFFEGFTSYYDDLFLLRSGVIEPARYLKLVAKTVTGVLGLPGRRLQSVAQASFDAWVKYYRTDENTPNATISYYTKGSLVALALDLSLRAAGRSLDDVMRTLWRESRGGAIDEADVLRALTAAAGRSLGDELQAFVHGTDDLPLQGLLEAAGVLWQSAPAGFAQRLGLRVSESALTGVKVTHVLRGGVAEAAGVSVGDELIAVEGWRMRRIDEAERLLAPGRPSELLVAREQRVLRLALGPSVASTASTITLSVQGSPTADVLALRKAWLGG